MSLDVLLVLLYPIVSAAAASSSRKRGAQPGDEVPGNAPLSVMIGVGIMLVVKAFASLTWG